MKTIILAGGFGTRVRHLLPDIPKPMAPCLGRPFIEWVVRFFARRGCEEFVLSTGYLSEVIERHFDRQPVPGVRVTCRHESTPQGTAGGALNCVPADAAPKSVWLVANGDSLVFSDPMPLLKPLHAGAADASLLGLEVPDAGRYGTLEIDANQHLVAFREKRPGAGGGLINAGVYAFTGATLLRQPERRPLSFEVDVFPELTHSGRVAVVPTAAPFLDIGTPETLAEAERFIERNQSHFLS
jgi:D-glycero-alpha-D-manno-heptose 1-phosphate guanylyltransferase